MRTGIPPDNLNALLTVPQKHSRGSKSPSLRAMVFTRYDDMGASSRVRTYQYKTLLERSGIDVDISPLLDRAYLSNLYERKTYDVRGVLRGILRRVRELRSAKGYDLLWVEKELFPWLPAMAERLFSPGIPCVLDFDDAIFHNYDIHPRRTVRWLLAEKIDSIMADAAVVVVGNQYLAHRARVAGARRVEILPSVVDLSKYPGIRNPGRNNMFTIGWIGSPSTSVHLLQVEDVLEQVCEKRGGKVVLVGSGGNPFTGLMATIRDWNETTEAEEIGSFDVGIMPLPDHPWERGKCGYKLIQYMACGKPVVASPVGVNQEIVEDGVNGFLASTQQEWRDALTRLKEDPNLRRAMGEEGRRKVEKQYCLHVTAPRLHRILMEAAGRA